jgi:acyl-CoA synthetase (AMP-forming)/AMP-acid ligase II
MVLRSPLPDVEVPDVAFSSFVLEQAAARADRPALIDGPTGRTLSYGELADGVGRLAGGLAARGIAKGDVVGICCPNLPEWALVFHGALTAGAVVTTLNSLYTVEELAPQLRDARARMLFTVPSFLDRVMPAAEAAGVEEVVVLGDADGATPLAELLAGDHPVPEPAIDPAADPAALPYSSGTSGIPKGVVLTHRNLVANVVQTLAAHKVDADDTTIAFLPFFHIYGMTVILNVGLRQGATIVTMPRFELEPFLGLLARHRVTRAYVVPPVVLALAKHPSVDEHDLSALEVVFSGAAPLGEDLARACAERVGAPVAQGYGMTECSPVSHITPDEHAGRRMGSVGLLAPSTECRLVDPLTEEDVAEGERGEIWIRGPQVMQGYLRNPDATAATLVDGWLRTGDIGEVDAEGWFTIVDRLKELIKYKGFQVAPAELEALLVSHPDIADAAVIGVPDDEAGEAPKAFVVGHGALEPESVKAWVQERVAPHKRLRAVEVLDEIPKSPSGKILRRVLVQRERERAAGAAR